MGGKACEKRAFQRVVSAYWTFGWDASPQKPKTGALSAGFCITPSRTRAYY
jgi:hypothetical protein